MYFYNFKELRDKAKKAERTNRVRYDVLVLAYRYVCDGHFDVQAFDKEKKWRKCYTFM